MADIRTVTLLFCDLVASSELMSRIGDDANDRVRREFFAHHGVAFVAAPSEYTADENRLTTASGVPLDDDQHSLTAGTRGRLLTPTAPERVRARFEVRHISNRGKK